MNTMFDLPQWLLAQLSEDGISSQRDRSTLVAHLLTDWTKSVSKDSPRLYRIKDILESLNMQWERATALADELQGLKAYLQRVYGMQDRVHSMEKRLAIIEEQLRKARIGAQP